MTSWWCITYFLILLTCQQGHSANILALPVPFLSHIRMHLNIVKDLIPKGHNVTFVLGEQVPGDEIVPPNINILYHKTKPNEMHYYSPEFMDLSFKNFLDGIHDMQIFSKLNFKMCADMNEDEEFIHKLQDMKFDLAIADFNILSYGNCLLPYRLGIPWVGTPFGPSTEVNRIPLLPSYIINFDSPFLIPMSFWERLQNCYHHLRVYFPIIPKFDKVRETEILYKYIRPEDKNEIPSWMHLARRTSLFFLQKDLLLEGPLPLYPNVISLGGLTAYDPLPVPGELGQLLDSASQGFILVSMGSTLNLLPDAVMKKLFAAFQERKELVIFRFDGDVSRSHVPKNVRIVGFIPQNDALGHKNIKLFITHAGNSGQSESLYHGVPMLSLPIFGDQPYNARCAEAKKYGITLDVLKFTPDDVLAAMTEIIEGTVIREHVQKASRIMKTRPMNPRQTAAFWIEHILEYGDEHLRSPALEMSWFTFYMVDILLFHIAIFVILLVAPFLCLRIFKNRKTPGPKIKGN